MLRYMEMTDIRLYAFRVQCPCEHDNPDLMCMMDGDISLTEYATDANFETRLKYGSILRILLRQLPLENILKQIHEITSTLLMVSEDKIPGVRMALVDQIPDVFLQIRKRESPDLELYLYDRLLQIIVQYLHDEEYAVKGEAYSAFLLLLDKNIIDKKRIVEKVCPEIICHTEKINNESETGHTVMAIVLMGRIAPIVGPEIIEGMFLDNFIEMCNCKINSVRRACATIFPVICEVMGTKITEEKLLDAFSSLCDDTSWSARKACAESIALISIVCSPECRRDRLTQIVLKLTKDESKWVVSATLKVLGQYISTFANPPITGLVYTSKGELHVTNPLDPEFKDHSDPKILANYDHLLSKLELLKLDSSTDKINDDALSCEEIAQMISDNKMKLVKQINDDIYIKKRRHDDTNRKAFNNLLTQCPIPDDDFKKFLHEEDDVEVIGCEAINRDNSNNHQQSAVSDSLVNSNNNNNNNNNNATNNTTITSPSSSTSLPEEKQERKHSGGGLHPTEHFWRKNTPTDLSSIIKKAINEGQETHNKQNNLVLSTPVTVAPPPKQIEAPTPTTETSSSDPFSWKASKQNAIDFTDDDMVFDFSDLLNSPAVEEMRNYFITEIFTNKNFPTNPNITSNTTTNNTTTATTDEQHDDAFDEFNSHKYWYISPELPLDNDLIESEDSTAAKNKKMMYMNLDLDMDIVTSSTARFSPPTDFSQDIVPISILECFIKMVLYEEDEEMNLSCAYNFPAVAFTIGKDNWHIIKSLLQYLCDDLDWKVRKTVASSIDLLAMILGQKLATQDLVPIYLGFFKDLDEVKIEAIRNFAKFLKVIEPTRHEEILSNIGVCLRVDSKTNWRIKEDLAKQIALIIKMYDSINRHEDLLYLTSVTALFLEDKVSCVRELAADAMAEIIRICSIKQREAIIKNYLVKEFALSGSWRKRQTFVNIFYKSTKINPHARELFHMVLFDLRRLSYDAVPNIRLLVAKSIVQLITIDPNILTSNDSRDEDLVKTVRRLQDDDDRDVKEISYQMNPDHEEERSTIDETVNCPEEEVQIFPTNTLNTIAAISIEGECSIPTSETPSPITSTLSLRDDNKTIQSSESDNNVIEHEDEVIW